MRDQAEDKEIVMTESEYSAVHPDFRSTWTTERDDIPGWEEMRANYIGKRTLMRHGALYIEGMGLTITPDMTVADADHEEWARVSNFMGVNAA